MPNRICGEKTLTLREATKRIPILRNNKAIHVSTVWRWKQRGLRGVSLECAKIGGQWVTSEEALERFFDAQENLSRGPDRPNPTEPRAGKEMNDAPRQVTGQRQDDVAEEIRRRFGM